MDGILVTLKPPGMTSHDVVDTVRRLLRRRRVGHTGTLDPGAAGVLVVCLGVAARLTEYLMAADKRYRAEAVFGIATDTHDGQGRIVREGPADDVTAEKLADTLKGLEGEREVPPPMVSAVRRGGKRLYRLAREGKTVEREPRRVHVRQCDLVQFDAGAPPRALFDVACSKGTYVRSLCADLGERLGCGAYMSFLVRTQNGPWTLEDAVTLEQLAEAARVGEVGRYLLPPDAGLADWPRMDLTPEGTALFRNGASVPAPSAAEPVEPDQLVRVYDHAERFLAVGRVVGATRGSPAVVTPVKVLAQGREDAEP